MKHYPLRKGFNDFLGYYTSRNDTPIRREDKKSRANLQEGILEDEVIVLQEII